ncbi:MAG: phospho-N-acetylmuramoyl-pentapeptide-transferase [Gaiellales bacterium]|nr:phospho-N-acetylmuramoyl-pentapeptide-transferase [Gaiellales bacterium]MDX6544636.1 phospho-N-acetylmuramoyl-pentapeptide-transferase [Gaiellales bacterium]MDX6550105.1 phospho-N-acetylmuramoyl-pentapeptide-transferase [Gaiellales bacterium]
MKLVLLAGVIAMMLSILAGPAFIAFVRRNSLGQHIREDGPAGHMSKQGTPTMGGLILLASALLTFAILTKRTTPALTVAGVTLACAGIGFIDDWFKLSRQRSLGLSGRWKMLLLLGVTAGLGYVAHRQHLSTDVYLPLIDIRLELGPLYYGLLFLVVAGGANAVNLTDGLDGLAAGTMTIAMLTYTAMLVVAFLSKHGLRAEGDPSRIDLAILGAALVGGCVGFLWYNAYPADVFMGDTGSFGLGGALAAMAVFTKTEFLLVLIGGVFVVEAMSVAIQVLWFKTTRRRVFLMAPIHHHFEMLEWTENKIIVRFWILASICSASGFVLYYLAYSKFR